MSWVCCICSRDNTSASIICACGHGTIGCRDCFSYDETCRQNIFLKTVESSDKTVDKTVDKTAVQVESEMEKKRGEVESVKVAAKMGSGDAAGQ